jgi:hypothetical protein
MNTNMSVQGRPLCFGDSKGDRLPYERCRSCRHHHDCLISGLVAEIDASIEADLAGSDSGGKAIAALDDIAIADAVSASTPAPRMLLANAHGAKRQPITDYVFDGVRNRADFMLMSDEELEAAHTSICKRTYSRSASPATYTAIRGDYCAASVVMNERGLRPPRFRSACKGAAWARGVIWTDELKAMSNDMKVIDLHWLHCAGVRSQVNDYEFRDLFAAVDFDTDLAARFVATNWKTESRVGRILVLADVEQWQVKKLASVSVDARWKNVLNEALVVEQRLKSAACRRARLAPEIQDYTRLWIAEAICGNGGQRLIGMVHGWQKGARPLAPSTLSSKLKTMRRWTKAS